jgi:hypothetical protein
MGNFAFPTYANTPRGDIQTFLRRKKFNPPLIENPEYVRFSSKYTWVWVGDAIAETPARVPGHRLPWTPDDD